MNASAFSTLLASVGGVLMSLLMAYVPGFKTWYEKLDSLYKRLVMLGLITVVAAAAVGLTCAGLGDVFGLSLPCDQSGYVMAIQGWIAALVANQSTYQLSTASSEKKKRKREKEDIE